MLVESLLFHILKVVIVGVVVERREIILFFLADLFLFEQPGSRRGRIEIVEVVEIV